MAEDTIAWPWLKTEGSMDSWLKEPAPYDSWLASPSEAWLVPPTKEPCIANLPNAITIAGYSASLAWLAGGPAWLAVAGILADELDGRVARARGETSAFGSLLDWAVDITLTGLVAAKLQVLWMLPIITVVQVALRDEGYRPPIGSARAALTVLALTTKPGAVAKLFL